MTDDEAEKQGVGRKPIRKAPGRRVTMTDIAKAAGCSQATVSFVLNDTQGVKISEETRNRVIEAARSLGYAAPSFAHAPFASSVPSGAIIGFVADQMATAPETMMAIDGARQAAWEAGGIVISAQTLDGTDVEDKTIEAMMRGGMSGLIYMTIFTRKVAVPKSLRDLPIPVVLLNCHTDDHAFPAVVPNELAGAQAATQHLISAGHRRIAMIVGEPWMQASQDRLKGYRRALSSADIAFDTALIAQGNWSISSGYEATQTLLRLENRPTAIYCQNDRMASGCYDALKAAGLDVPGDISVIGYDDDELCRHLRPQLGTSLLPHRAMGIWAVEQLAGLRPEAGKRFPLVKLECPFISRDSVRVIG